MDDFRKAFCYTWIETEPVRRGGPEPDLHPCWAHHEVPRHAPRYRNSYFGGEAKMCILCDKGFPQNHAASQLGRRDFLKASTATAAAAAGVGFVSARPAPADVGDAPGYPRQCRPRQRHR